MRCMYGVHIACARSKKPRRAACGLPALPQRQRRVPLGASLVGFKNCADFHMVLDF